MMNNLTVAQLIQILQTMPQDAVVEISMNQEYQSRIERSNVVFVPFTTGVKNLVFSAGRLLGGQ